MTWLHILHVQYLPDKERRERHISDFVPLSKDEKAARPERLKKVGEMEIRPSSYLLRRRRRREETEKEQRGENNEKRYVRFRPERRTREQSRGTDGRTEREKQEKEEEEEEEGVLLTDEDGRSERKNASGG